VLRQSVLCVLPGRERQSAVPAASRINVLRGLSAPGCARSSGARAVQVAAYRPAAAMFIRRWWPADHQDVLKNSPAALPQSSRSPTDTYTRGHIGANLSIHRRSAPPIELDADFFNKQTGLSEPVFSNLRT
jgi:hypothetical protein